MVPVHSSTMYCNVIFNGQALESEVSDHLREGSVLNHKLKSKQKEVLKTLKTLDREVKVR